MASFIGEIKKNQEQIVKRWWKDGEKTNMSWIQKGPLMPIFCRFLEISRSPPTLITDGIWDARQWWFSASCRCWGTAGGPEISPGRGKKQTENKKHGEWRGMLSCFFDIDRIFLSIVSEDMNIISVLMFCVGVIRSSHLWWPNSHRLAQHANRISRN